MIRHPPLHQRAKKGVRVAFGHLGEQRAADAGADAGDDHHCGKIWRAEVAETNAADHRCAGQAGQSCDNPVATRQAEEGAVTDAAAPGDAQQEIDVGRRLVGFERRAARMDEHDQTSKADCEIENKPGNERRGLHVQGDGRRDQQAVDHAPGEHRQGAEQRRNQGCAYICRHAGAGIGQPMRQAPARQTVDPVFALHGLIPLPSGHKAGWGLTGAYGPPPSRRRPC